MTKIRISSMNFSDGLWYVQYSYDGPSGSGSSPGQYELPETATAAEIGAAIANDWGFSSYDVVEL
jgi:hypothetical protein